MVMDTIFPIPVLRQTLARLPILVAIEAVDVVIYPSTYFIDILRFSVC